MRWLLTIFACKCLANDPLLTFDESRRVPFSAAYSLNVWQWWAAPDTNAIHVYDASGNYLPALDEPNGTNHAALAAAWRIQPHANSTPVAVIDQGLHGAQVASMLGAPEDGAGIVGAACSVPVLTLATHYGAGQVAGLIVAAVNAGAKVVNMSFGYVDAVPPVSVIEAMRTNDGVLFVLAALNGIGPEDHSRDWLCLAHLPNAICVTASTKACDLFGAYGTNVTLAAPGRRVVVDDHSFPFPPTPTNAGDDVPQGEPRGLWSVTGTSFAAPIVAGIAALCMERHGETPAQVIERLCVSAVPVPGVHQTRCGGLNAERALTWCRYPVLSIGRETLSVGGPAGSVVTLGTSTEPGGPWVAWATVTNTGWPQALPYHANEAQRFWRMM